jgi:hypothetical protein
VSKRERLRGQVEKIDQNITTVRRSYSLVDGVSSQKRGATIIRVVLVVRRVSFQPLELTTPPNERQKKMEQKQKTKKGDNIDQHQFCSETNRIPSYH